MLFVITVLQSIFPTEVRIEVLLYFTTIFDSTEPPVDTVPDNETSTSPADIVIYKGKDLKDKEFKDTLDEGAEIGRLLFTKYTNFETDMESGGNDVVVDYSDGTVERDVDDENMLVNQENKVSNSTEVFYDGIVHHTSSLVQHYINKGRSKLVSK